MKFSDHRPVTATYMAEVEVFSPKKLQRALTFTDAEIANEQIVPDMSIEVGMNGLKLEQVNPSLFIDIQARQSYEVVRHSCTTISNYKTVCASTT